MKSVKQYTRIYGDAMNDEKFNLKSFRKTSKIYCDLSKDFIKSYFTQDIRKNPKIAFDKKNMQDKLDNLTIKAINIFIGTKITNPEAEATYLKTCWIYPIMEIIRKANIGTNQTKRDPAWLKSIIEVNKEGNFDTIDRCINDLLHLGTCVIFDNIDSKYVSHNIRVAESVIFTDELTPETTNYRKNYIELFENKNDWNDIDNVIYKAQRVFATKLIDIRNAIQSGEFVLPTKANKSKTIKRNSSDKKSYVSNGGKKHADIRNKER